MDRKNTFATFGLFGAPVVICLAATWLNQAQTTHDWETFTWRIMQAWMWSAGTCTALLLPGASYSSSSTQSGRDWSWLWKTKYGPDRRD